MSDESTKKIKGASKPCVEEPRSKGPQSYGRYQVIRHIASGGMGSVYLAHDAVLQREVAVKSVRPMTGKLGEEFAARFLNEARCVASLKHPNIVPIFDLGVEDDVAYLVMEVIEGPSLSEAIKAGIGARQARVVGIQIANALAEAHRAGIVHRDVKPANILAAGPDTWKLVDFGVAHAPDSSLTSVGDFLGTPAYAAPESLCGEGFSPASDVYGLAATLYHALGGKPPHGAGNPVQVALRASVQEPISLGLLNPRLPADMVQIIDLCLSRTLEARPSAAELASQLASARPDTHDGPTPAPPVVATPAPPTTLAPTLITEVVAEASSRGASASHASALSASKSGGNARLLLPIAGLVVVGAAAAFLSSNDHETKLIVEPAKPTLSSTLSEPVLESIKPNSPLKVAGTEIGKAEPGLEGLAEVESLIAMNAVAKASRALDRLRRKYPQSAYLAYLQGTLYMERSYWQDGFSAYRVAVANNPKYSSHPRLIKDGVRGLYSVSKPGRASKFLREVVGGAARPALKAAFASTKNTRVKSHIKSLLNQLPK